MTVALIGTGLAGLACADRLWRAGVTVRSFDKGRRPGGRMATRGSHGTAFDHGAQYATARGADFQARLEAWRTDGVAAIWPAASTPGTARWVGVGSMAAIPAALVSPLPNPPEQGRHVAALHRRGRDWYLRHHDATEIAPGATSVDGGILAGPFAAVLIAIPAPQAAALLAQAGHAFADAAAGARYAPCWTLMATYDAPSGLADIARPSTGPLSWVAREGSRPGRMAAPDRFVAHASPAWSREHLDASRDEVATRLAAALPTAQPPTRVAAHRWRHAQVEQPLGQPCLWDAEASLGACGDWCLGGRVEAAWDSGRALADALLAR